MMQVPSSQQRYLRRASGVRLLSRRSRFRPLSRSRSLMRSRLRLRDRSFLLSLSLSLSLFLSLFRLVFSVQSLVGAPPPRTLLRKHTLRFTAASASSVWKEHDHSGLAFRFLLLFRLFLVRLFLIGTRTRLAFGRRLRLRCFRPAMYQSCAGVALCHTAVRDAALFDGATEQRENAIKPIDTVLPLRAHHVRRGPYSTNVRPGLPSTRGGEAEAENPSQ
jgi:hypothetical protein